MTNHEAVEMIRNDMKLHYNNLSGEYRRALSMAISALQEQEAKRLIESSLTQKPLDTISRQAAIDALIEGFKRSPTIAIRAKDMIEQLSSAQPEPQWIPVSERLPENDDAVLISHKHGVGKAWWNGRFWSSATKKCYKTVTAWMPLPEPYRAERRTDNANIGT